MKFYKILVFIFAMGAGISYAGFSSTELETFNLQETKIEQTNLQANVAGGVVLYGSGVLVQQTGRVDSDARPATYFQLQSTPISSNDDRRSGDSSKSIVKIDSGVPGSASVTNNFQGQVVGGSSSINSVLPNGTVSSSNITTNTPTALASETIAASGNANANGSQSGAVIGAGGALGLAGAVNFSNFESFNKTINKTEFENTTVTRPVIFTMPAVR
jgi:hypothetical protein